MKLSMRQNEDHPSLFTLTRYHAGDLNPEERKQIDQHLHQCATCQKSLDSLGEVQRAYHAHVDRDHALGNIRSRASSKARLIWLQPAVAGAFGLFMVLLIVTIFPSQGPNERLKGDSLALSFIVQRNGEISQPFNVKRLHALDRIQFRLTAPVGGYVHLVAIDQQGNVSVYFPHPEAQPMAFAGGSGRLLPGSIILDDTLGKERVFALVCEKPIPPSELTSQVQRFSPDPRIWLDAEKLPIDCEQTSLAYHKE